MRVHCSRLSQSVVDYCRSSAKVSPLLIAAVGVVIVVVVVSLCLAQGVVGGAAGVDDWPTYMLDASRSGCTQSGVKPPLQEHWVFTPTAPPKPAWADPQSIPVEGVFELPKVKFDDAYHVAAADGAAYFGTSDNKVYSLDAASGKVRWTFFTDGPVRLSPMVYKDRVYFGADDGRVYCLKAADGSEVWRHQIPPTDERLLGSGKMVSVWPVRTGALVYDDTVYAGAGVFPGERVYLCALRADDGALVWKNDTLSDQGAGQNGFSPQGYLLANKDYVFAPSGRSLPACFNRATGQQVYQKNYSRFTYGPLGGSWALLANGQLFSGGMPIYGYEQQSGAIGFAWFPSAKQLVVSPDITYVLQPSGILALDRQAYPTASRERQNLANRRSALVQAKPKDLEDQLKKLQEQEQKNQADLDACEKWVYDKQGVEAVIVAGDLVIAGGAGDVVALDKAEGKEVWSAPVDGKARGLAVAGGRLLVSTDTGKVHCFAPGAPPAAPAGQQAKTEPFARDAMTPLFESAAETIVKETGIKKGYCLVLGCGTGRLAYELAKRTDLTIYGVEADAAKVEAARRALDAAGLYGSRICMDRFDPKAIGYSDYFANLVVSEEAVVSGKLTASAEEAYRMLKPCGGVMLVGQPAGAPSKLSEATLESWVKSADLEGCKITAEQGVWARLDRGMIEGAGQWTHQYGDAGNTASSTDTAVECPLSLLWYGEPGPDMVPSRHARNVAPLSIGGRVYLQGINRIMCFDAYNGVMYWEKEIQGAYRVGSSHEASNIACDDKSLFVATGPQCLRLDAQTGETLTTFEMPVVREDGKKANWAYLAVVDGVLYGSAATRGQYADVVFAYDTKTAKLLWQHKGNNVRNNTIAISDGRMFFADDRATADQRNAVLKELATKLKADQGLDDAAATKELAKRDVRVAVGLDARTGGKLWEVPLDLTDCGADLLIAMASEGVVAFSGAFGDGHYWNQFLGGEYANRRVTALSAKDGSLLWSKAVGCRIRPLIVGDTLYAEPWAFDLQTGEQKMRTHPLTGRQTVWEMERPGHHCGCISGSPKGLYFRSYYYGYYDLVADQGTEHFSGVRPGCWINMIPANGLLVVPEASSGCVCLVSIHCTTVLKPSRRHKAWGLYASRGEMMPIKNLSLNLGAPGDRTDSGGKLWLSYPRPGGRMRLNLDLAATILPGCGYYGEPAERYEVAGSKDGWLYASGCAGLAKCSLPLAGEGDGPAEYTVRLGFAAPEGDRPGQRVFDIKLQGKVVAQEVDVVKEAGGGKRVVVKEFKGVRVDRDLQLELVPKAQKADKTTAPLINTLEVARERVLSVGMLVPSLLLSDLENQKTGEIALANRTDKAFVGTLRVAAPDLFAASVSESKINLPPDARMTVQLTAKMARRGEPGNYKLDVSLVRPDGAVELQRQVAVEYLGPRERMVVKPLQDTWVGAGSPTADNSTQPTLLVDGGGDRMGDQSHNIAYLRFPINVPGKVVSVILRIRTAAPEHSQSGDSGRIHLTEKPWEAGKITYAERPKPGKQVGTLGNVGRDVWIERPLDVDLTGMKELSLVLEPTSCDGATYLSSKGKDGPELVIEYTPG